MGSQIQISPSQPFGVDKAPPPAIYRAKTCCLVLAVSDFDVQNPAIEMMMVRMMMVMMMVMMMMMIMMMMMMIDII